MKIYMTGLNFRTAELSLREQISFTNTKVKEILANIRTNPDILGAVIICTCNRTELYLSCEKEINPTEEFYLKANINKEDFHQYFYFLEGDDAIKYLFELTCGFHSMIFGEDQILSQVKDAIALANEGQYADATLNTLFRYAITCGKKVKTNIVFKRNPSVAHQTADVLKDYINKTKGCKALVIGNGEIGRKMCEELVQLGVDVTITLRTYKHGETVVPRGCKAIDYYSRQEVLSSIDILISATTSAHHTISYDMIENLDKKPKYIIDLAVPRDIDPQIKNIDSICYYNMDNIGQTSHDEYAKELKIAQTLVDEQIKKFFDWHVIHKSAGNIKYIKNMAIKSIAPSIDRQLCEQEKIEKAITKTVDYILYSLRENASDEVVLNAINCVKEGLA